jgi:hypothetical protein
MRAWNDMSTALSSFTELSTFLHCWQTYIFPRMTVGGSSKTMSTAPGIIGGRTMIPLRFLAENLGCLVGWYQPTQGCHGRVRWIERLVSCHAVAGMSGA